MIGQRLYLAASLALIAIVARGPLEQTMQRHMLLHVPIILLAGASLVPTWEPNRHARLADDWNANGVAGLILASGVVATWMVPRALDAAVEFIAIDIVKLLSLLAAGAIARVSWRQASALVRTFVVGNMAWMMATVGMLLIDAPVRLCTNYGSSDQRMTGIALVILTVAAVGAAAIHALFFPRGSETRHRHG